MAKFTKIQTAWTLVASVGITLASPVSAIDLLAPGLGANFTHIDAQQNTSSWAAANLLDDNLSTLWRSSKRDNDLILSFNPAMNDRCFGGFSLENYGNNRSVRQFMLLYTNDTALSADTGAVGWTPIAVDSAPSGPVNHLHWGQGGRLTAVDSEQNSTTWAAEHINNGSLGDFWRSTKANNTLDFAFDTDWDGNTGDAINITQLKLHNYGNNRSIKLFQVEVSQDGTNWEKLEVPGTGPGDDDFNYALSHEGGQLGQVNPPQQNNTTWSANNLNDGDLNTFWRNTTTNNNLEFVFDPDGDGNNGMQGDADDLFQLEKVVLHNYGNNRSVRQFQILVKTTANSNWTPIPVAGSLAGQPDFNFALVHEGGLLTSVNTEQDNSTWAGANIYDGSSQTFWRSTRSNNTLDFEFDPDGDNNSGLSGDADDYFKLKKIVLENYGNNRSVNHFQIEVKTAASSDWTKLEVPGSDVGDTGFNFLSKHEGAILNSVDAEQNNTTWAAENLYDGDQNSFWRSTKQVNTLDYIFDTDLNGTPSEASDKINFSTVRLRNYGNNRSVATFELDVKINGGAWQAVPAPGGGNTFTATSGSAPQEWNVAAQSDVTAFRIRTLSNHGDAYTTGMRELELLGTATRPSHTYVALRSSAQQVFSLDDADQPDNVTAVRFRTISNHGDAYTTGARELRLLGDSVTRDHTFVASRDSSEQTFSIAAADQPTNVTAVQLKTISNYGDAYTIGAREIGFLGKAVTASHTFSAEREATPQTYVLDIEDKATNVVAARLKTIRNHGDSYTTGAREFELLGDPVAPLYIFDANRDQNLQNWNFPAVTGKLFRFHTFDNYGDSYTTGAREIGVMQAVGCYPAPVGAWNMDEPSWGTVTDSSGNNLNGSAYRGANTIF